MSISQRSNMSNEQQSNIHRYLFYYIWLCQTNTAVSWTEVAGTREFSTFLLKKYNQPSNLINLLINPFNLINIFDILDCCLEFKQIKNSNNFITGDNRCLIKWYLKYVVVVSLNYKFALAIWYSIRLEFPQRHTQIECFCLLTFPLSRISVTLLMLVSSLISLSEIDLSSAEHKDLYQNSCPSFPGLQQMIIFIVDNLLTSFSIN